jgi:hypothetical protein
MVNQFPIFVIRRYSNYHARDYEYGVFDVLSIGILGWAFDFKRWSATKDEFFVTIEEFHATD